MARAHLVKKAAKDYPEHGIKKGEPYWWWKFKERYGNGTKIYSKTQPRRSQLTRSSFLSQLYEIQDGAKQPDCVEDFEGVRDTIRDDLSSLKDEVEGNLENMPEQFRDGDTVQVLQNRIDSLDNAISELENVECEFDPEDCPEGDDMDEFKEEWMDEKWGEIDSALNNIEEG